MPSRFGVAVILLFWAATTAYVVDREVLPRYLSGGPPAVRIDLSDEAAANVPAKWVVARQTGGRGDAPWEKVGGLSTTLEYDDRDDTFRFVSEYRELSFPVGAAQLHLELPRLLAAVRVTRAGALREQSFAGQVELNVATGPPAGGRRAKATLAAAAVAVAAEVAGDRLVGRLRGWLPAPPQARTDDWLRLATRPRLPDGLPEPTADRPLDPVPVPHGQVLNPMLPVARLADVRPGRRWAIRVVDPLGQAVGQLARELAATAGVPAAGLAVGGAAADPPELIAEVRAEAEDMVPDLPGPFRPPGRPVRCWVIDYRGGGVEARTWVNAQTGRVERQEAGGFGERLRFEREY